MEGEVTTVFSPMLAVLTAVLLCPLCLCVPHIILMRTTENKEKAFSLLLRSCAIYGASWLALGFYLNGWAMIGLDSFVAGFSTIAFLALGYAEFFSMICRGFSLRILVDIHLHKSQSLDGMLKNYAGRGMDWMFNKRLETIKSSGLVKENTDSLELKNASAAFIGKFSLITKDILKMGKGG